MDAKNLAELYGLPLIDWQRVEARLTAECSAPSAGSPPWRVYRLTPREATVVLAAEPGGATRSRF